MKRITGHLTSKNQQWYAVLNLYDTSGKRSQKWINLDLKDQRGTKTEANHRLAEILAQYNTGDLYLQEAMTHADRERNRIANMLVEDYLREWLEQHKPNISSSTYLNYKRMINGRMTSFFKPMRLKVKEITGDEINAYYTEIRADGLKGTTAQRHHAMLHRAFQQAVKRRIIPSNPCQQADRPNSVPFIGNYYNAEELKELLNCVEGDSIRLVIMLAAYYGLRRSEVLGLKWSAVDFTAKTVSIRHKILEEETKNGVVLKGYDVMKTKSSYRTLPLIPHVEEELLAEKVKQAEMRKVMRGAYSKDYAEYICVDALGSLITPQYVSNHFQVILRESGLRKIRFHDLRHSCASLLLANNIPMKMIQDWLGHSDMSTTANIYSHIDSSSKLTSANTIGEVLGVTEEEKNPESPKDEDPE